MAKNKNGTGNPDPHIDEFIDAQHPGLGPKTPTMASVRAIQNEVDPIKKPMKAGKNYNASPDTGGASLNPFRNWSNINKAFKLPSAR